MPGPHQIDSVTPNHAVVGVTIDIVGTQFGAVQGLSTVRFESNQVAAIVSWTDTLIRATVPALAVEGPLRVVVGGQEVLAPRNADFFWLDVSPFPGALQDLEFQNTGNDSLSPDDLSLADARDFNTLAEIALATQKKVGIDGSADPASLDFKLAKVLGSKRLVIKLFETIPPTAIPPPLALPTPVPIGATIHTVHEFPAGADTEFMFRFTVPSDLDVTVPLAIVPVFTLSAPPGAGEAVVLDIEGDLDGVPLPPLGGPGVVVVIAGVAPGLPFFSGLPPIALIPTSGAPPIAPPDSQVALRIKRLALAGPPDTYGGGFQLDKVFVGYAR